MHFGHNLKKISLQNGYPIVFSKSDLCGGKTFLPEFLSEKAKRPRLCPSFGVNVRET